MDALLRLSTSTVAAATAAFINAGGGVGRNRHLTFPQISPADTKIKYGAVYGTTFYEDRLTKGEGSAKAYVKKEKKSVPAESHEKFKTLSSFPFPFCKSRSPPSIFP